MIAKDVMKGINFGDIDGLYDPLIKENFVDLGAVDQIFNKDKFFVIGRKGTGKSALYKYIHDTKYEQGNMISNFSFKHFPFEKLLELSDDSFSRPNQYQSIWRNIILNGYANLIVQNQTCVENKYFLELKEYIELSFGNNLKDLHKKVTTEASKDSEGLQWKPFKRVGYNSSLESSKSSTYDISNTDLTILNERLFDTIESYLLTADETRYFIQFDQLDDNYNLYTAEDKYFQAIISLFKSTYDINQLFRSKNIKSRVVVYLRSDIFFKINSYDPDSARWDNYRVDLNWSIKSRSDWRNSGLEQIIDRRLINSFPKIKTNMYRLMRDSEIKLESKGARIHPFKYIVHRSFHRPRDIIQFYIKIQDQIRDTDELNFRTIKDAEKEYSLWLLSELENEIAPRISDVDALYELLRSLGRGFYSISTFKDSYKRYNDRIGLSADELLEYLYSVGIIMNINPRGKNTEYYSIIRNERSRLNRDLKIMTHEGFYFGLYTSQSLNRR